VPWFKYLISGENFCGELIGREMLLGFYTTRFIEALDAGSAESRALERLQTDPNLAPPPGFAPTVQAKVYVQEVEEVGADVVPATQPGIVWYRMENVDSTGGSG